MGIYVDKVPRKEKRNTIILGTSYKLYGSVVSVHENSLVNRNVYTINENYMQTTMFLESEWTTEERLLAWLKDAVPELWSVPRKRLLYPGSEQLGSGADPGRSGKLRFMAGLRHSRGFRLGDFPLSRYLTEWPSKSLCVTVFLLAYSTQNKNLFDVQVYSCFNSRNGLQCNSQGTSRLLFHNNFTSRTKANYSFLTKSLKLLKFEYHL